VQFSRACKAALRALAHTGCTGTELMALRGHGSLAQLQVYLDEVDQEHQADAAIAKLMASRTKRQRRLTNLRIPTYKPGPKSLKMQAQQMKEATMARFEPATLSLEVFTATGLHCSTLPRHSSS
jgi:hypothetical protein